MAEPSVDEIDGTPHNLRSFSVGPNRIGSIQKSAQRIVDLVRERGGESPEADKTLPLCEPAFGLAPRVDRASHFVEVAKQLREHGVRSRDLVFRNRLRRIAGFKDAPQTPELEEVLRALNNLHRD